MRLRLAISSLLLFAGLGCVAFAGFPSSGQQYPPAVASGPATLWSTTAAVTSTGAAPAGGITFVSKWTQGVAPVFNSAPPANANIKVTFTAGASILTIADAWLGAAQTLASQCSGTTRLWNFAPGPTHLVTVSTAIPANSSLSFTVPLASFPGAPFVISHDVAATKFAANETIGASNYSPISQTSNFNRWFLSGTSQSATACKNASYTPATTSIGGITAIVSMP